VTITIHNYIVVPDHQPVEIMERPMRRGRGPRVAADARPVEAPAYVIIEEVAAAMPSPSPPLGGTPPVNSYLPINGVVLIPGLPDPHGNGYYRLQVGAYSGMGSVALAMSRVEAAGFTATQERHGNLLRVIVEGVPTRNVQAAVQRLAAVGFSQIWIVGE